ncbi:MAG: hydrolase [Haloarculaceae archaeon]
MFEEWQAAPVGSGSPDWEDVRVPGKPDGFAGKRRVQYRTEFEDPRGQVEDVATLVLNGCYASTEVELTGEILGNASDPVEHDAYFEPIRIPFRPHEETAVLVTCEEPSDRFGGLHDTDAVPESERVPGIWWRADLETHELPYVDALRVRPEVTGENARLHVQTTVVTDGPLEERITYSLRPEGDHKARGTMQRGRVDAAIAGRTTVEHTIDLRDPARWWPAGYGNQHRYTLRAKLGDSERSVTTGICEVERDGGGLVVNGQPVPIRGLNLTTADPADVGRAREVNATVVRAHAQVLPPSVYGACDRAGVLVWQDLPLTGPGAFDEDRAAALGNVVGDAYSRFPSFGVVGVHDDPTDVFGRRLGSGLLDSLRLRWRAWRNDYDPAPAERVADAIDTDRPVVPVVGEPGTGARVASLYPGWAYGTAGDIHALLARYPAEIVAEFGAGAYASEPVEDAAGFDPERHAARVDGDVEDSQAYQASVLKTVTEHLRLEGRGAIAYSLRDTDAAGTGVYAVDGTAKPGRNALAAAFAPIQAFLVDPSPGECDLVVRNDGPSELSVSVTWRAGDDSGTVEATVDGSGRWSGGPVPVPTGAEEVSLTLAVGEAEVENRYDL